ncbi:MAG: hypothetical protein HQL88_00500 [Magnetococcales bacterium]|nr:hypothetical protein [Magnetococcales bacterium]
MNEVTFTLLLSQKKLPESWCDTLFQQVPRPTQAHLFCLDQATHLLHADFAGLPPGERLYCAHGHRQLSAPEPPEHSPFVASSLVNLGALIRASHATFSIPHSHWSGKTGTLGVKNIGILLGALQDTQAESIRLATGLAACNHAVTLYTPLSPAELRQQLPETATLLEALLALRAVFKTAPSDALPGKHEVLLQL